MKMKKSKRQFKNQNWNESGSEAFHNFLHFDLSFCILTFTFCITKGLV